jgi:hypothetical protein
MLQVQRIAALSHRDAGSHQDWKPATLKAPVLGCFIAVSLLAIVVLEILWHISSENGNTGGLSFAKDVNSLPMITSFGYLYFPTVLAGAFLPNASNTKGNYTSEIV